jgi:hypothetical protein
VRTRFTIPAVAAAILLVAIALPRFRAANNAPVHRSSVSDASAPVVREPVGDVTNAAELKWAAVPGSDRYRVTLFDTGGRALYEVEVADTALTLPDSVSLTSGRSYLWKVEARVGIDRWSSSELTEFRLQAR